MKPPSCLFRVRTVTAFLSLQPHDFPITIDNLDASKVAAKVNQASQLLQTLQSNLTQAGYEVQTLRLATNPFGEWIVDNEQEEEFQLRLDCLNKLLEQHQIAFLSLGCAQTVQEIQQFCVKIVTSGVSCSAHIKAGDVASAQAAATCILQLDGLDNFRFCASNCQATIPFFPAAKSSGAVGFALGLENGFLAHHWLTQTKSIANIDTVFRQGMTQALMPLQDLCQKVANDNQYTYFGIDTSLNPSLDEGGSVAAAIECLEEIESFGGPGTVAAAAAITTALQSLEGIQRTGYCGLMLPVCEDQRLAELAASSNNKLSLSHLLSISSVCGVGIDTVPLAGDVSLAKLTSLLLDVAGLAERWDKSLSCRVLPFKGKKVGDVTDFDSPYMVNTQVFDL